MCVPMQPVTTDPTLDLSARYPLQLSGSRQCETQSLPDNFTHNGRSELNPGLFDFEPTAHCSTLTILNCSNWCWSCCCCCCRKNWLFWSPDAPGEKVGVLDIAPGDWLPPAHPPPPGDWGELEYECGDMGELGDCGPPPPPPPPLPPMPLPGPPLLPPILLR